MANTPHEGLQHEIAGDQFALGRGMSLLVIGASLGILAASGLCKGVGGLRRRIGQEFRAFDDFMYGSNPPQLPEDK